MQYAYFDLNTGYVLGWIDTGAHSYDTLPPAGQLLELTPEQYEGRPALAWVVAGQLSPEAPPAPLAEVKAAKLAEIYDACAAACVAGFTCDALGAPYVYPSKLTDQSNLQARVVSSLLNPGDGFRTTFWCEDATGAGAYREHTAAQIRAVGLAGEVSITGYLTRKGTLEAAVQAAKTAAAVAKIKW